MPDHPAEESSPSPFRIHRSEFVSRYTFIEGILSFIGAFLLVVLLGGMGPGTVAGAPSALPTEQPVSMPAVGNCSDDLRRKLIRLAKAGKGDISLPVNQWRLSGWLNLIKVVERAPCDSRQLTTLLLPWLDRYPSHPAVYYFPDLFGQSSAIEANATTTSSFGTQDIAILVPLHGHYAEFSRSLVQGAQGAAKEFGIKLSAYDTEMGLGAAYRLAIEGGADCIIGPLRKDHVRLLATLTPQLPVLTLNYLPHGKSSPPGFYQMALAPEDEAQALSDRLVSTGHARGVMMYPQGWEWAERIATHFKSLWAEQGGEIAESVAYDPTQTDFTVPIQNILGIKFKYISDPRTGEIRRSRPRRRTDIDFILLLADYRLGRMLHPQLRFWYSDGLPVYSSSHILGGRLTDIHYDLEGVRPSLPAWLNTASTSLSLQGRAAWHLGESAVRIAASSRCMSSQRPHENGHWWLNPASRQYHYRSRSAVIERGRTHIMDK
jgi:outer membrane PBP1 activator LpoA protein